MSWNRLCAAGIAVLAASATGALAADLPEVPSPVEAATVSNALGLYLHAGAGGVILSESAKIKAGGQTMVGATISIQPQVTGVIELGQFITPNLALSATAGWPPIAKVEAAGTMDGYGQMGQVTYGPVAFTAHYHFTGLGRFQPYIGAGPVVLLVFKEKDGLMSDLFTHNSVGAAIQAGADFMLDEHWGLFVDVKKAILRTKVEGFIGVVPIDAKVKLDPLVLSGGVTYRF